MRTYIRICYLVGTMCLLMHSRTLAGSITLFSQRDSSIFESDPNGNYGDGGLVIAEDYSAQDRAAAYLWFNIGGPPEDILVRSAKLKIYCVVDNYSDYARVAALKDAWTEYGVTWNNTSKQVHVESYVNTTDVVFGWVEADVTKHVREWDGGGWTNNGLVLLARGNDGNQAAFWSREASSDRPRLVIDYISIPQDVDASDGQFDDRVHICGDAVSGADCYRVNRDSQIVGSQVTETCFDDTGVDPGTTYSYTVRACWSS